MLSVGIGLTSRCNCSCEHCYSRIYGNNAFLNTDLLMRFFEKFRIGSVNFGTGESYFHPDFLSIIDYLNKKRVKMSVTSNGYTIAKLDDVKLAKFHDIDFSLDYPNEKMRIFLVNNQGSDDSFRVYTDCQELYPDLLMQWLNAKQGKSRALNLALFNADGKYIIHVDSDGQFEPHAITNMVEETMCG